MSASETLREKACSFVLQIPSGRIDPDLLAPDFDCWNAAMGGLIPAATYLEGIAGAARVLPGMVMEVDGTVVEGSDVAVRASSRAQLPDGTIYGNHYHFLFHFEGAKVRRIYAYMDTKTAAEVLVPLVWGERRDFQDSNRDN
jgi:ketosteroid isomerase-like protein